MINKPLHLDLCAYLNLVSEESCSVGTGALKSGGSCGVWYVFFASKLHLEYIFKFLFAVRVCEPQL